MEQFPLLGKNYPYGLKQVYIFDKQHTMCWLEVGLQIFE